VYRQPFRDAARLTGVDEAWLRAIAHVESGFAADAVSPKGAVGVMQLMPETAADYDVTDRTDPNQSIQAGARHLRDLIRRYPGDLRRVAAAYNAGTGAVDQFRGVPPYAETQAYVEKALLLHTRYLDSVD
jgi:soluble lytic murein transglycosylase-like protein